MRQAFVDGACIKEIFAIGYFQSANDAQSAKQIFNFHKFEKLVLNPEARMTYCSGPVHYS